MILPASTPSSSSVVNGWVEAFNTGNILALGQIYSDDVFVSFGRFGGNGDNVLWWESHHTRFGIAAVLQGDRDGHDQDAQFTLSDLRGQGNSVTSQITYTDE